MKVTSLLFVIFLSQVSGSFFDDFRGEVTSLAENFENFVSDVVYDVRETIDCSILAVKQVLALGNFEESDYYNTNCKPPSNDVSSDSQEDCDDTAPTIVRSEIVRKEDEYDTTNTAESSEEVFVKSQFARKEPDSVPHGKKINDDDIKNEIQPQHDKNEKHDKDVHKIPEYSENNNSTDKIQQQNKYVKSPAMPSKNTLKTEKIESSETNNTHINIHQHVNTKGKNQSSKLQYPQNLSNETLLNSGSLKISESSGTPVDKKLSAKNVQNKLKSLIDTHKKLKETKNRLENKTKDLDKLHTMLHHELRNLTATVEKVVQEASASPAAMNVLKNAKKNKTIVNSSGKGNKNSHIEENSYINDNKMNSMPLWYQGVDINVTNSSKTSYNNESTSFYNKELVNGNLTHNTSNNTVKQQLSHLNQKQNKNSTEKERKDLGKTKTLYHTKLNNVTANNETVKEAQYNSPASKMVKAVTKVNNIDIDIPSNRERGKQKSQSVKQLNVLAKKETSNKSLFKQHSMMKTNLSDPVISNKNKLTSVSVEKNPRYNNSIENPYNMSVSGNPEEIDPLVINKQTPLKSEFSNQNAAVRVTQHVESSTQNKTEVPINIITANETVHKFDDQKSNISHIANGKDINVNIDESHPLREKARKTIPHPSQSNIIRDEENNDTLDYDPDYFDDFTSDEDYYDDEPLEDQDYNDLFQNTDDAESRKQAAEHVKNFIENSKRSEKIINDYLRKAEKHGIDVFNETQSDKTY